MNIHLIAIGGAIMHQLAISLSNNKYTVTGSDDVIKDPSYSHLNNAKLLPNKMGFDENNIHKNLDLVILGMHAKADNPELLKAKELGLKIMSFPEYIYEHSKNKKRIVIAGSHGKTSITSMIMHVLKQMNMKFDYAVGSSVDGFEHSVQLTPDAPYIIIEGDEYLSSPIDLQPKFIHYQGNIGVLSGIEWDHINVFPTESDYFSQFKKLVNTLDTNATLFYYNQEKIYNTIKGIRDDVKLVPYQAIPYKIVDGEFIATTPSQDISLTIFGEHNMQNIQAAKLICNEMSISDIDFFQAMRDFQGAGRRLETIYHSDTKIIYKDFAHSPSKLIATVNAVKQRHPDFFIVACFELHTFSTLSENFLPNYKNTMERADEAIVFLNKKVVEQKGNYIYPEEQIQTFFNDKQLKLFTDIASLETYLNTLQQEKKVYLMMSSGNFSGLDLATIG